MRKDVEQRAVDAYEEYVDALRGLAVPPDVQQRVLDAYGDYMRKLADASTSSEGLAARALQSRERRSVGAGARPPALRQGHVRTSRLAAGSSRAVAANTMVMPTRQGARRAGR
jgi:hypothetical protein